MFQLLFTSKSLTTLKHSIKKEKMTKRVFAQKTPLKLAFRAKKLTFQDLF